MNIDPGAVMSSSGVCFKFSPVETSVQDWTLSVHVRTFLPCHAHREEREKRRANRQHDWSLVESGKVAVY